MKRLWSFIAIVDILALAIICYALRNPTPELFFKATLVAVLVTIAELYPLDIFDEGDLTLSALIQIISLLVIGFEATMIGDFIGILIFSFITKRPLMKMFFNAGQYTLSIGFAYYIFNISGGSTSHLTVHSFLIPITYIIVNLGLVSIVLSLFHEMPVRHTWRTLTSDALPYTIIVSIAGLVFAGIIISYDWIGIILFAIMVVCLWRVLYQAGSSISSMKNRYKETIAVLTTALEFRDPYTHGHSQRVASWCKKIAQEMHLVQTEVDQIELGGLMHDVGKVGVPDHILKKTGQLTKAEYAEVQNHTAIGERILNEIKGMDYVAAMARQHHLYYNGDPKGYPDSYPGSQALLGSRILGVADAWDAMTGDRPYRRSLTIPEAVAELRANSGSQFDPEVVEAFIRVLKADRFYGEEAFVPARKPHSKNDKSQADISAC